MRAAAVIAMAVLAAFSLAGPVLAADTSGKVTAIEGDKVVVQAAQGAGEMFPAGTKGVEIKAGDGTSLRGKVVAAVGDRLTLRILKGKASSLRVGASVELQRIMKAGSEEMQGC